MALEQSIEQLVYLIRSKDKVAVLLYGADDDLCSRALGGLSIHENRLRSLGYKVYSLRVGQKSAALPELACVRVPQLRFFSNGKILHKIVGPIDESSLKPVLK